MQSKTAATCGRRQWPTWKAVSLYYAISIAWAWLAWSPIVLGTRGLKLLSIDPSLAVLSSIATLGPFFGCFITHHSESGNWKAVRLLPHLPSQWIWLLLGPLLILVSYFLVFPAFISKGSPVRWQWHPAVLTGLLVPMFNYNLLGGPLFEEFGWRGFLQARLQRVIPAWVAAICVGLMWAAWHAPLFLTIWSSASPLTYLLIVLGLSPLFAYAFNGSGGAVLSAILMHSAFNSSSRFLDPFLGGTPVHAHPSGEVFIALAFIASSVVVVLFTRGHLNVEANSPIVYQIS